MSGHFTLSPTNPNELTGPGGCLCSEEGTHDTAGPYAVFYAEDMESVLSPTPVVCACCIRSMVDSLEDFEAENSPEV